MKPEANSNVDSKNRNGNSELPATRSRSRAGCVLLLLTLLVATVGILFLIQMVITPADDPSFAGPAATEVTDQQSTVNGPEFSVAKTSVTYGISQADIDASDHPLIPLLQIARDALAEMDQNVQDYTATVTSRVRTNDGVTHPERCLVCNIRHANGSTGLSVYLRFLNPGSIAGQEAIWVDGSNDGKLIGHGTGLLNFKRMNFHPDGLFPMKGNRHPISKMGMKNLLKDLIEKGEADLKHDDVIVMIERGIEIDGVACTLLQIEHPDEGERHEFHIAKIYIDDARNLPVAYEGYLWPLEKGGESRLLEKYFYSDIQLNVGLTDADFDPDNEAYNYPSW